MIFTKLLGGFSEENKQIYNSNLILIIMMVDSPLIFFFFCILLYRFATDDAFGIEICKDVEWRLTQSLIHQFDCVSKLVESLCKKCVENYEASHASSGQMSFAKLSVDWKNARFFFLNLISLSLTFFDLQLTFIVRWHVCFVYVESKNVWRFFFRLKKCWLWSVILKLTRFN